MIRLGRWVGVILVLSVWAEPPRARRTYPETNARARTILREKLPPVCERLKPLHKPLAAPQPRDWLAAHHEDGQSFAEYKRQSPVRPTKRRKYIDIFPLGEFYTKQKLEPERKRCAELLAALEK